VLGSIRYLGPAGTRWQGTGGWTNKSFGANFPFLAVLEPTAQFGMRTQKLAGGTGSTVENGYRFQVDADGIISVSDGMSYTAKASWRLQSDGSGWETREGLYLNGGDLAIQEITATPANPPASNRAVIYVKGDKLVVAFNDAGTMRYKYLPLNGTVATWTHTTTAP
jgi:hypothetical protein